MARGASLPDDNPASRPPAPAEATRRTAGRLPLVAALSNYRHYRLLWFSTVLTQIGQWMLQISLGWLMLVLTDSASWVGLLGFAAGFPFLIVSIPAGVLIDRFDRRLVLVVCQAAATLIGLGLAVLVTLGVAQPWHLLTAALLNSAALAANTAARQTMLPALVNREHLQNAIALLSAGQNSTRIIGPALAGPLIATVGASGALYLEAAFLLIALVNTMMLPAMRSPTGETLAMRRDLADGIAYIVRSPVLCGLMVLAAIPTLLVFPYIQFLPVFARDILGIGAEGLGLLFAAGGVGAVAGAMTVAAFQGMRRKGLVMLAGTIVYGLVVIGFAYSTWVPTSVLFLFLGGLLGSTYLATNNTLLHLHTSDEMRGRVMGVYMLTWGLNPLGALPMGFVGDHWSVPNAVALGAVLSSAVTIVLALRSRALRAL